MERRLPRLVLLSLGNLHRLGAPDDSAEGEWPDVSRIAFSGSVDAAAAAAVTEVVRAWLGDDAFSFALKMEGWSAVHEDARGYVYFQEFADDDVSSDYTMQGYLVGSLAEAGVRYRALVQGFRARGLEARLDYVEVDDDGAEQSEPFTLP